MEIIVFIVLIVMTFVALFKSTSSEWHGTDPTTRQARNEDSYAGSDSFLFDDDWSSSNSSIDEPAYLTDPTYSFLAWNIHHSDDSSSLDSSSSSLFDSSETTDYCTDPTYSFMDCNIFHTDDSSFDSSFDDSFSSCSMDTDCFSSHDDW